MGNRDHGLAIHQAEQLLRAAVLARPQEAALYAALGEHHFARRRWGEAVECYAAARALRPELGMILATALARAGRQEEGLVLLTRMAAERHAQFERQYGTRSDALPSIEFLDEPGLRELARTLGIAWEIHRPWYGWRWHLRPLAAGLKRLSWRTIA